ncbi:MAG: ATP-binding cassette domain-containing protein [Candidatus Omnitrophota bacterium]|nr:ATP-binding cassette domain-containing protein [Candidatus Omnitrophota bacterium]
MQGTFKPQDILCVAPYDTFQSVRVGDVVMFRAPERENEVVHRVVAITPAGARTQGDNNPSVDPWVIPFTSLLGRVAHLRRAGVKLPVHGGMRGRVRGIWVRKTRVMRRLYFSERVKSLLDAAWFFRYVVPHRKAYGILFVMGCASSVVMLALPFFGKSVVDRAIMGKDMMALLKNGINVMFIIVITTLINIPRSRLRMRVNFLSALWLKRDVMRAFQRLPIGHFQARPSGEHLYRVTTDIDVVLGMLAKCSEEYVIMAVMAVVIVVCMAHLDLFLTVVFLSAGVLSVIRAQLFGRSSRAFNDASVELNKNIFGHLREVFASMYAVKALRMEKRETNSYVRMTIAAMRLQIRRWWMDTVQQFVSRGIEGALGGAVFALGMYRVVRGDISTGTLTALFMYANQANVHTAKLLSFLRDSYVNTSYVHRLRTLLEQGRAARIRDRGRKEVLFSGPVVDFCRVSFSYNTSHEVLRDISIRMPPGLVALAGASGCGKTTLLNLVLGLYVPARGIVSIDGAATPDINDHSYRTQMGVALQEPYLWNDTVANNIKYGFDHATDEDMRVAAVAAGVDIFAQTLPHGYDTAVGDNACRLSEGQKQKIAIARALIRRPRILILDEAMSAMDSESEQQILRGIREMRVSLVIVVSHRLSSIMACERVYFLKSCSEIVAGSPRELLETDPAFHSLFAAQLIGSAA